MASDSHDVAFAGLPADLPGQLATRPSPRAALALASLGRAAAARLHELALQVEVDADDARLLAQGGGIALYAWPEGTARASSPCLFLEVSPHGWDIGVATGGDPDAAARLRRALLGRNDPGLREACARLLAGGWRVGGEALPDAADGSLPEWLRPWLVRRALRAERHFAWPDGLEEPSLAEEVADHWREVLPLLDVMRAPSAASPSAASPRPGPP